MNKILRYSFVALLAMIGLNISAQEVTLDFTITDPADETGKTSIWGFPSGSSNKLVEENSYTYDGWTVKVAGSTGEGYYWHNKDHYLLFGKQGAYLTLPAFNFDVERIDVEGNSAASAGTKQNIFVGDEAVSTETTGAQGTNYFAIAEGKQAAGTIYTIKVTSKHNNQIKTIKIWKKGAGTKQAADISWSSPSATVTIGADDNIFPTLNNPNNLTVTYTSSKEEVATVDANGAVTLVAAGSAKISAVFEGNDTYEASTVSYNLTVKEAIDPNAKGQVNNPYTVAEALEVINALENGATTSDKFYVKGFVVGTPSIQKKDDGTFYGNANFDIADTKGGTDKLTCFRLKGIDNANIDSEDYIKENDELVVMGQFQKYVSGENVTPEVKNGHIVSITREDPGIDPTATIYEVPVSKFTPWDNCTIEGNKITMGEGWKGGAIQIGKDMTQFDYVWIKFKDATGTPNFGITYDEWQKNESWGPVFAATTTAMDGTGMVGIKLDKKTVMVHGNAETDGVGIGDVYAQHVQQVTVQGGSGAASVEVEGIWFGTTAEFVKAGGDVPVRPEAGGSLTMWEGELVYDGWGVSSTVDAKYFEVAQVGDIIYCTVKDVTSDYNPLFKYQDWSDFTDIQATLAKDETHFEGKIATADALDYLQKNGLRFQGLGFTLTKVELKVPGADGINNVTTAKAENAVRYNLAGQKVNNDYKGVVIMNGKKMLNK